MVRSIAKKVRELLCPVLKKVFGDIDCSSPKVCICYCKHQVICANCIRPLLPDFQPNDSLNLPPGNTILHYPA
jgi:hypothetical protein